MEDFEAQMRSIEQKSYASVLRAFKAQADAISWEKESLITDLRKELRVSDDEHRELLSRLNADETLRGMREWRPVGGRQTSIPSTSRPFHDLLPSLTIPGSCQRQRASQSVQHLPGSSTVRPMLQYPPPRPPRSRQYNSRGSNTAREGYSLVGKKVRIRRPYNNRFREAVITKYSCMEGKHALVYDMYTPDEILEWVDLKEILPQDIHWDRDLSIHAGSVPQPPHCSGPPTDLSIHASSDRNHGSEEAAEGA